MEYSIPVVCLLGIGIVFFGLICLVFVIWLIGRVLREKPAAALETEEVPATQDEDTALKVAITAALAEFLRVDYQDIHIVSVTRREEKI